jgi:hypothetical protein
MQTCSFNFVIQTNLERQLRFFTRIISGILIFASLHQRTARGQETKLIDLPVPKLEILEDIHSFTPLTSVVDWKVEPNLAAASKTKLRSPKVAHRSRFTLDRPSIAIGLVQGASALYDGATTKYFLHHCSTCIEVDPLSRALLGSKPTWGGMIAAGSIEVVATTYLHQCMHRSPHKFLRNFAPLIPLVLTGVHLIEGSKNLTLKNQFYCATPGYVVVAGTCVPPSSGPAGFSYRPVSGLRLIPQKMTWLDF